LLTSTGSAVSQARSKPRSIRNSIVRSETASVIFGVFGIILSSAAFGSRTMTKKPAHKPKSEPTRELTDPSREGSE
jgi:hypothetical protein